MPASCGRKQSGAPVSDIDAVLDTDVLIEIFRGDDQARAWLVRIESHVLGIPIFVYMEILLGARTKRDQRALAAQPALSRSVLYCCSNVEISYA